MTSKYLYGAAAAALLLSACSQDEVVNMRQDGINYNVLAKNQTRAADSYCNILLPGHFNVWARTAGDNALYINGDKIVNKSGSWTDEDGVRYWPQGKNLDFFAHVNGDGVFDYNNGAPKFNSFKVKANVPDQLDLMYAVENNASNSSAPVTINFRHALSQVCFRATNNTKNLQVTINSVTVGHLTDGGTYTYPTASTTQNIVDPDHDDIDNGIQDGVRGGWVLDNNYNNTYTASVNGGSVTLASGDVNTNLTCPGDNHANGFVNVMTLMPQRVNAWDPSQKGASYNGAYFLLDVVIENVVDGGDNTTVYSGGAVVPVNVNWKEGYRYIYTFIFDEGGNGGFTPNPDDPQPVLAGIQYNVTVDDFIPVNGDGSGTGMDTGYKYSGIVKLHSNYDTDVVTQAKINTNNSAYTFTFGSEYTPTRTGYTFQGWASSATATTVEYAPGATTSLTLTEGSANTFEYYAIWTQDIVKKNVDVFFNDGNGNITKQPVETTNGKGTVTFPAGPTREHWTFGGWILDGSNPEAIYQPGSTYEFTEPNIPSFTAKMTEDQKYSHKVTLSGGDWTATYNGNALPYVVYNVETYNETETFTLPTTGIVNTENNTLVFGGWKYKGGTKIETSSISVNGEVELEVIWKGKGNIEGPGNPGNEDLN